jgi:DNA-directed RNA polymerase subunit RPC12/RpoP
MSKKLKLQCWNCPKTYFATLDITDQQEVIVRCPYCKAEAVVNLKPYRRKTMTVLKHIDLRTLSNESNEEIQLPDVLPTRKPE